MKKKLYMIPESEVIDLTLTNSLLAGSLEKTDDKTANPEDADAEEFYNFEEEGTGLDW